MQVTEKLTMADYDLRCRQSLKAKLPDPDSPRMQDKAGDAIWRYASPDASPELRRGCHDEGNRKTDLGGKYALLGKDFVYFGKNAPMLPEHLLGIVKQGPGHRAAANAHLLQPFLRWIQELPRGVLGEPQRWQDSEKASCASSCARHDEEDEEQHLQGSCD